MLWQLEDSIKQEKIRKNIENLEARLIKEKEKLIKLHDQVKKRNPKSF